MLLKRNDKTIACILEVIPARLAQIIGRYIRTENVEEIRFRINRPVQLVASDKDVLLTQYGVFSYSESGALLHRLCMGSVYALEDELAKVDILAKNIEGKGPSGWILLDFGDLIVNIFSREQRAHYNIEKVWGDGIFLEIEEDQE